MLEKFYAALNWLIDPVNLTAISTVVIAAFTIVLAVVGYCQARLIRKSIDLARQEFIATHRPKLRIRRITPSRPFLANEKITTVIEVTNVGSTDATIDQIGVDVYRLDTAFDATPKSVPTILIPPGKQANISVVGSQVMTEAEIDSIEIGTAWLRLLGIIIYTDANGTPRSTSFARYYSRRLHRFEKVPSDDQEADREYED